jgi:hypothetical protein
VLPADGRGIDHEVAGRMAADHEPAGANGDPFAAPGPGFQFEKSH